MTGAYIVRSAHHHELDKLVEISRKVLLESVYSHMDFDKDKSANYICGAILGQPGWFLRVIARVSDDEPVGGIACYNQVSIFGKDKIATDVTIMIDAGHRGKCVRQMLQIIREFREWAIADGAKLIKIGVSSGINIDKASAVFERMGFARIGAMHGHRVGV